MAKLKTVSLVSQRDEMQSHLGGSPAHVWNFGMRFSWKCMGEARGPEDTAGG